MNEALASGNEWDMIFFASKILHGGERETKGAELNQFLLNAGWKAERIVTLWRRAREEAFILLD